MKVNTGFTDSSPRIHVPSFCITKSLPSSAGHWNHVWSLRHTGEFWARRRAHFEVDRVSLFWMKTFSFFFLQLPLLKALIDRLLQEGIEELLQVLGTVKSTKETTDTHTSNVITEFSVRKEKSARVRVHWEFIESPWACRSFSFLMCVWKMSKEEEINSWDLKTASVASTESSEVWPHQPDKVGLGRHRRPRFEQRDSRFNVSRE